MTETDIVKILKTMGEGDTPHDKKTALLAELVTQKFNGIDQRYKEMSQKLGETNEKLDELLVRFDGLDKKSLKNVALFMQHPKLMVFILCLVGIIIILSAGEGVSNIALSVMSLLK